MKVALCVLALLLAAGSGWFIADLQNQIAWKNAEAVLVTGLALLCLLPFYVAIHRRQFDLFEPIYVLSGEFFAIYVLGALVFILQGLVQREDAYRSELAPALLLAVVGLIGGYLGYALGRHWFSHKHNAWVQRLFTRTYDPHRAFYAALGGLGVAIFFYGLWMFMSGRSLAYLNLLYSDTEHYTALDGSSGTLYFFMFRNSWHVLIVLAWAFAPKRSWKGLIGLLWLSDIGVAFLRGNRQTIFFAVGVMVITWYLLRHKRPSLLAMIAMLLIGTWVAGYTVSLRGIGSDLDVSLAEIAVEAVDEISYRSALYGSMVALRVFPDQVPYVGLNMFRDLLIAWIPRTLWPEKPIVGTAGAELLDYMYGGKHVSFVIGMAGHYYVGFGLPGVFVVFTAIGILNAFIYEIWLSNPDGRFRNVFLSIWLIFFLVIIQRGNPDFFLVNFGYFVGPLFLVWAIGLRRARVPSGLEPNSAGEYARIR